MKISYRLPFLILLIASMLVLISSTSGAKTTGASTFEEEPTDGLLGDPPETNASAFVENYPDRFTNLFSGLDLQRPSMEAVLAALKSKDTAAAGRELLKYYRSNAAGDPYRPINWKAYRTWGVDEMLDDVFSSRGVKAKMIRGESGYIDWNKIPEGANGDIQFNSLLSRFGHVFNPLLAYHQTHDLKYLDFAYNHTREFVLGQPIPEKYVSLSNGGDNHFWFPLNAALRLDSLGKLFYALEQIKPRNEEDLLLLLSSIYEHAEFIIKYGGHGIGNHDTTHMEVLLLTAIRFPEFKKSLVWASRGANRYAEIAELAILPDGAQRDLAIHYSLIVMRSTYKVYKMLQDSDFPVPMSLTKSLENQINALAWISKPDGRIMAHGNSDNHDTPRNRLYKYASEMGCRDAIYITSVGEQGSPPEGPPSRFFDWSGFALSRSGFGKDDQWSAFNVGPIGEAHIHPDQLSIEIYNGRDILVDPGRYSYSWSDGYSPNYFHHTRGHNTVLVDGYMQAIPNWREKELARYFMAADNPLGVNEAYEITPDYDNFRGRTYSGYRKDNVYGPFMKEDVVHERALHYRRGKFWVAVDRITSEKPRKLDAFWHFHPDCKVIEVLDNGGVATLDPGKGNLLVLPIKEDVSFNVSLHKGETNPIQGWYSHSINYKVESFDAIYTGEASPLSCFGWLFLPFHGDQLPEVEAVMFMDGNIAKVIVTINDEEMECDLRFSERPALNQSQAWLSQ